MTIAFIPHFNIITIISSITIIIIIIIIIIMDDIIDILWVQIINENKNIA